METRNRQRTTGPKMSLKPAGLLIRCRKCKHNDSTYGCMNPECEVNIDRDAGYQYERKLEMEEDDENENNE